MYCCHSVLEYYNLFSGVKLSIRSFCFIFIATGAYHPRLIAAEVLLLQTV